LILSLLRWHDFEAVNAKSVRKEELFELHSYQKII